MADSSRGAPVSPAGVRTGLRQAMLTGVALTIPLFVTLLVLGFLINTLSNVLDPIVVFAFELTGTRLEPSETPKYLVKLVAAIVLFLGVLSIGVVAERRSSPGRIESTFTATMERIPGLGSIYSSFDEMSEMLLDSDTQSFQEVVLVEHPTPESYTVAFVTASTPESIERATDSDGMLTLFMPMAPNPVMGGHVVHVPASRVYDVDMTVEEGIRSIVTSGVAIGENGEGVQLGGTGATAASSYPPQSGYHTGGDHREPTPRTDVTDRASAYTDDIDPKHVRTPEEVAQAERDRRVGADTDRPNGFDQPSGTLGDDTEHPEAFEQQDGTLGSESDTPSDIDPDREEQN